MDKLSPRPPSKAILIEEMARKIFRSIASSVWIEDQEDGTEVLRLHSEEELKALLAHARRAARIYYGAES